MLFLVCVCYAFVCVCLCCLVVTCWERVDLLALVCYARWLPVHLRDMALIETIHPMMALEFKKGHFAVHKTERMFSAIAIDQAHEQNNKVIKGDGGAVGLTEDASALRRWMVSGPEISRLIEQFEYDNRVKADFRHRKETEANQTSFLTNVKQMTKNPG